MAGWFTNSFLDKPSVPEPLLLGAGTAAAPTYSFSAFPNTGLFMGGSTLNIGASGAARIAIGGTTNAFTSKITTFVGNVGHEFTNSAFSGTGAGEQRLFRNNATFSPTSGSTNFVNATIDTVVNQTGGANGNVTGIRSVVTGTAVGGTVNLFEGQYHATTPVKVFSVDSTGQINFIAGNEQTTVGSAGAASAPPATPTKYFKFKDSAGTVLVVPAYAAA